MTPEQVELLRKARENLRGAVLLSEDGLYSLAAGRAYYAMFHVAEAFVLGRGLSFSKHSAVHSAFGKHFANPGLVPVEMHRELLEAARTRTIGEYGIGPGLTREDAEQLITQAKKFIRIAEERIDSALPEEG